MLKYVQDDITKVTKGLVIHGTNCSGGFGSGVAGAIKSKWPKVCEAFKGNVVNLPEDRKKQLGTIQYVDVDENLTVANCYTQEFFGNDGKKYANIQAVESCLLEAFDYCDFYYIDLHSPKIGCGLGGLSWDNDVLPLFNRLCTMYPKVNCTIYSI